MSVLYPPVPPGLEYKESSVHGIGVFAVRDWKKDEEIGDYAPAVKMTKPEFRERYGSDIRHTYWTSHNFKHSYVLVAKETRNFVTYINEAKVANVYLKKQKLFAAADISAGSELFLTYAKNYPREYTL